MKWRKFDKKVSDEMTNHQSEVDIDALWGAIEPAVDAINEEKKKKRRGVFWWFFGAILLAGIGFGIFILNNKDAQTTAELTVEKMASEDAPISNFNKKEVENAIEKTSVNTEESADKSSTNFDEKGTNKTATPIQNKKNTKSIFSKKEINNSLVKQSKTNTFKQNENLNIKQNKEINPTILSDISNSATERKQEAIIENKALNSTILQQNGENNDKNALFCLPVDLLEQLDDSPTILERKILTKKEAQAIKKPIKEVLAEQKKCAKQKVKTSIGLYSGIGLANRNLTAKNDSTSNGLLQLREDTERNLETIQLGLQFNLEHKKTGLGLTTGLNYTQINERFDYNTVLVEVDSIEGVEFLYKNVNGDTVETMGILPRTTTTTVTNRHYNKYQLIDIPILLSYRKHFGQFSVGAQAGVFVNLQLKTAGRILNSSSEILSIEDNNKFKSTVGLSYYFGATIDYHLTKKWSISAAPFVRHLPNNFSDENYELEQKYTLFGLNLGLRYSF